MCFVTTNSDLGDVDGCLQVVEEIFQRSDDANVIVFVVVGVGRKLRYVDSEFILARCELEKGDDDDECKKYVRL